MHNFRKNLGKNTKICRDMQKIYRAAANPTLKYHERSPSSNRTVAAIKRLA
ncbi:hypothetical protein [Scytonema sp. HK-05]|uniref:hypothetical protein n=1 Tax=Scytonema sp. HK-05 TaxID=1137095 RepID=UPI000B042C6C